VPLGSFALGSDPRYYFRRDLNKVTQRHRAIRLSAYPDKSLATFWFREGLEFFVTAHPFLALRFNWAIDRRIAV
jgi:hypothetical protein